MVNSRTWMLHLMLSSIALPPGQSLTHRAQIIPSKSFSPKLTRTKTVLPRTERRGTSLFQQQQQQQVRQDGKKRLATGMAFLTGWADVTLFLKYKTFATMMTGNTMWMAQAAVEQRFQTVGYYAAVICSYLTGLVVFRRMDLSLRKQCLRACALLVMVLFAGSDVINFLTGTKFLPVAMLAVAYGIINSIGTEVAGTLTFVITGHLTKVTHLGVDRISRTRGRKKLSSEQRIVAVQNTSVISGFFGGAMFACLLQTKQLLTKSGVFSILGLLYATLFYWLDMESLGGAWWLRKNGEMCELDDDGEVCDVEEELLEAPGVTVNSTMSSEQK